MFPIPHRTVHNDEQPFHRDQCGSKFARNNPAYTENRSPESRRQTSHELVKRALDHAHQELVHMGCIMHPMCTKRPMHNASEISTL